MSEETQLPTESETEAKTIADSRQYSKQSDDETVARVLTYPKSDSKQYGARVTFTPNLITGPKLDGDLAVGDFIGKMASLVMPSPASPASPAPAPDGGNETKITPGVNKPLNTKKVQVYLPVSFNATDTLTYDSPSIGSAGAILAGALNGANGSAAGAVGNAVGDFIDLFKGAGATSGNSLAKLGAAKLARRGPTEVGEGAAASLRVTADPNIRTLFRGVAVRQFAFQFKFIAKSAEEAKEIKDIITRFRFYAYPESINFSGGNGAAAISVGFKYPHPFTIKAEYVDDNGTSKRIGPRMKNCYLTNITTNYNPSTMAFHRDGEPVEIDLSLSFTEETTLNKDDILAGY